MIYGRHELPDTDELWRTLYRLLGAGALLYLALILLCLRLMLQLPSWRVLATSGSGV